nr:dystrobrevin [Hymenolepis microstoma]
MHGTQDLQQPVTTATSNLPSVPSKDQNPNLFHAPNDGHILMGPPKQMNQNQLKNHQALHQQHPLMYQQQQMNQIAVDSNNAAFAGFRRLLAELKAKKFDQIRFAAYRTASKLRYIQKRTLLSLIELWRLLEIFRELGLHMTDPTSSLNRQGVEHLLNRIYGVINPMCIEKALTPNETSTQLVIAQASEILLGWLTYILDPNNCGRMTVSGLKVALSTLVTGKPADKFTYHYSLLVNSAGVLQMERLEVYLQELLSLAVGVFEEPNFSYNSQTSKFLLMGKSKTLTAEEFVEKMLTEPGPQSFSWLKVFHRLGIVENVQHPLKCEGCKREPIVGLRYKCTRCPRYNLCQDCFWTGITTGSHTNSHDVKEYTSATKPHSRQFGHSLRKSFQFGRQQSLPSGQSTLPSTGQQQMANTLGAVRGPFASYPHYRFYRPGMLPTQAVMQNHGMQTVFQYPVPGPGATGLNRLPPTPIMQARTFHRATSVPIQTQAGPQMQQGQPVFSSAYVTTAVQPLPPPGRDSIPQMAVARSTSIARQKSSQQQQPPLNQTNQQQRQTTLISPGSSATAQNPLQQRQPPGSQNPPPPPHRQLSTDGGEIGTTAVASQSGSVGGYCDFVSAPGNSDTSNNVIDGTLGRKPTQQQSLPSQHQHPTEGGLFRQLSVQTGIGHPEEHKMIANYSARMAASRKLPAQGVNDAFGSTQSQRELVAQLEAKNREILMEIQRLKMEQANQAAGLAAAMQESSNKLPPSNLMQPQLTSSDVEDPQLVAELNALRQRKSELEARMNDLQGNRRDLTIQLETLMRLLKTSPGKMDKLDEDPIAAYYHQQNYYSRPRTANALLPRRSCSLVRRTPGTRSSLEVLTSETGHQRSLDAESLLASVDMNESSAGNTMSLQRRSSNRLMLSPERQPGDVSHKSRPRNLSHSIGPAGGTLLRGGSSNKQSTSVLDRWQYPGLANRGSDLLYSSDCNRGNTLDSKERTPPGNPQHSSKVTLELSDSQRNSSEKQRQPLSISVQSHQRKTTLSEGSFHGTDSDVGESSQQRPFNCAAAFEPSSSSANTVGSSSDVYLYSDPEMISTGWQDNGRRNQYKSIMNNTNNGNSISDTNTEQASIVTVVSAPGTSITASSMRAPEVVSNCEKKNKIGDLNA